MSALLPSFGQASPSLGPGSSHFRRGCSLGFVCLLKRCCCITGDHRLALLLSQLAGSQDVRELLAMQLADWHQLQADCFIQEERLHIFALLAGKPVSCGAWAFLSTLGTARPLALRG